MSLAATLAADGMRPASFLPAIKCSSCGDEIQIAAMGDHTCASPPSPLSPPASMSNPFTLRQLNAVGHTPAKVSSPLQQIRPAPTAPTPQTRVRAPTITTNHSNALKPSRTAPPRINADAANKPFLAPRPPRSHSPISPALSVRSGSSNSSRPSALRSMTSPMPRMFDFRPPSPELSGGFDCAFPSFPASSTASPGSRPSTSSGRKTPTGSERAPSRSGSRQGGMAPSFGMPGSVGGVGGDAMRDNDRGRVGHSNTSRRPSAGDGTTPRPLSASKRRPSLPNLAYSQEAPPTPQEPVPRPGIAQSARSESSRPPAAQPSVGSMPISQHKAPPTRPARPEERNGTPRFLDELSAEPVVEMPSIFSPSQPPVPTRSTERSRTFPLRQESDDQATAGRYEGSNEVRTRGRDPVAREIPAPRQDPPRQPMTQQRARSQSRSGPRSDYRTQDAPPIPKLVQQHKQDSSHAPSESGSSTASSAHSKGNSSSDPSPISSTTSSVDAFSALSYDSAKYGEDPGMRVVGLAVKNQVKPGMRAEQPASRSPTRHLRNKSSGPRVFSPVYEPPLESPMDPSMRTRGPERVPHPPWQAGSAPPSRPIPARSVTSPVNTITALAPPPLPSSSSAMGDDYDPYRPSSPQPPPQKQAKATPPPSAVSPYKAFSPTTQIRPLNPSSILPPLQPSTTGAQPPSRAPQSILPPPSVPQDSIRPGPPPRRPTNVKPTCRGCYTPITGKSVKAADGRLTGRWHKPCFVCVTCAQPFTTADFYVIDNAPYCEQHYHEANGSLCQTCHTGIEGQYLETTTTAGGEKKFHPRCFTCVECRIVLSEDYFEISGRVFCERHALSAMRGQARIAGPSSTKGQTGASLKPSDRRELIAERRTTKLMMM